LKVAAAMCEPCQQTCPRAFREHCVVPFVELGCVDSLCARALRLPLRSQCAASA
jgi:hypothetical protein